MVKIRNEQKSVNSKMKLKMGISAMYIPRNLEITMGLGARNGRRGNE